MRDSTCTRAPAPGQPASTERRVRRVEDVMQNVRFCATCAPRVRYLRPELELRVLLGAVAFCGDCRGAVTRWMRLDRYESERARKRRAAGVPVDAPVRTYRCGICGESGHNARRCDRRAAWLELV